MAILKINNDPLISLSAPNDWLNCSVSPVLERTGDHASNIAEDVLYSLTGDICRHGGIHDTRSHARLTPYGHGQKLHNSQSETENI